MSTVDIFDIKRFAVHDGPGIRTTVFMKGCPLRCWWCHNPESQSRNPLTVEVERKLNGKSIFSSKTYGERVELDKVMETVLRDRHFYEESGGGVTFSGGEPLMQYEALKALLSLSRANGLHTSVDTSGFGRRDHFEEIAEFTDLFLYDLKNIDPDLHREHTGVDNKLILSNADFLLDMGARVIFRIPVIPGINTPEDEMQRIFSFVEERKEKLEEVHLLPYHRIAESKYARLKMEKQLGHVEEPDIPFMEGLRKKFETTGLKVSIGG